MADTVGFELLNEIERVSAKRQRWITLGQQVPGLAPGMSFGLALMKQAIEAGKAAITDNDAVASIAALETLRGYDSDD